MHVHPDIAALRGDRLAQRRIRARMVDARASWRGCEAIEELAEDLVRFDTGEPLAACRALGFMMSDHSQAIALVVRWLESMLDALREEPLGEVPHLYRCSAGLSSIQLLKHGCAALNLVAYEPFAEARKPQTALFADRESVELVLAGAAHGMFHRRSNSGDVITTDEDRWITGDQVVLTGSKEARQIVSVEGSLLLLQLTREPIRPAPSREFRLSDGALLQSASGDKAASQRVMALAVLGAMGHGPALGAMEARALDRAEDLDVRWEAVRQALALDAMTGMGLLARLRECGGDPLSVPATSLERQLLRSRPELCVEAA